MKNLNDIQISYKKTGYGNYDITVFENNEEIGTFHTTNAQVVDDIQEMNKNGFEHEMISFETFDELKQYCLDRI